jgi:hypothetical protein
MKNKIICIDKMRDYEFFWGKIMEFDELKILIFNDSQALSLKHAKAKPDLRQFLNTDEEVEEKICGYFIKLLQVEPLSGYDDILFSRLDEKIK